MDQSYFQDEVDEEFPYEAAPRQRMSGWVIALIVLLVIIVLCCLCLLITVAGMTLLGPAISDSFATAIEEIMTLTPVP
jgi:hypothetical protein